MSRPRTWSEQALIDKIRCKPGWTWLELPLGKSRCVRAGGGYTYNDKFELNPTPNQEPTKPPAGPPPPDMENIALTGQIDKAIASESAKRNIAAPMKKQRQRMAAA